MAVLKYKDPQGNWQTLDTGSGSVSSVEITELPYGSEPTARITAGVLYIGWPDGVPIDSVITEESDNPVTSAAIYQALQEKIGIPSGGTTGQVLTKTSGTDYDAGWATPEAAPVQSVNNKTGAVVLDAQDVGAYEKPASGIPASDLADGVIPDVPVQDVQVNGTSILNQGVANIPIADIGVLGTLYTANDTNLKQGTATARAITPLRQHLATFYGLAKAAGDATQSQSSNPVGTYTDEAKAAIQTMLDVPSEAEFDTLSESVGDLESAIVNKADKVTYLELEFKQGNRNSSGEIQASDYRISNDMIRADTGLHLKIVPNGQLFTYRIFDSNMVNMIGSSWISTTTDFICPIGCYYQFVVMKNPEARITPDEIAVTFEIINDEQIINKEYQAAFDSMLSGTEILLPVQDWDWFNKTFSASTLDYNTSNDNTRLSLINAIPLQKGNTVKIEPSSGYKAYTVIYTISGTTKTKVTDSGWVNTEYSYIADDDCYVQCTQGLSSDNSLPPADAGIDISITIGNQNGGNDPTVNFSIPQKFGSQSINLIWEQGGISNDGLNTRSDRIRAKVDTSHIKAITYSLPSGYNCSVWFFSKENGTKLRDTGWDSTGIGYRLCVGDFAYIQIHKTSDSDIHPNDVTGDFVFDAVGSTLYEYDGVIKTLCHRGYSIVAPENTAISFTMAAQKRMKYVETDVRFTSDGVAVMLHDASINRTARNADGTALSSTVNISGITYSQALEYDFGIYKGAEFAGEKILTFAEFVLLCKKYDLFPIIEIKTGEPSDIVALQHIAESYGMHGQYGWIGATVYLQALLTDQPTALCIRLTGTTESSINETVGLKTSNNRIVADFSISQFSSLSAETIQGIASAGVEVGVWDISTEANVNTVFNSPYVTWFTTDGMDVCVAGIV